MLELISQATSLYANPAVQHDTVGGEPDKVRKAELGAKIAGDLYCMIIDAQKILREDLVEEPISVARRNELNDEYKANMDIVRYVAEEQYRLALALERQDRCLLSGQFVNSQWNSMLIQERQGTRHNITCRQKVTTSEAVICRTTASSSTPSSTASVQSCFEQVNYTIPVRTRTFNTVLDAYPKSQIQVPLPTNLVERCQTQEGKHQTWERRGQKEQQEKAEQDRLAREKQQKDRELAEDLKKERRIGEQRVMMVRREQARTGELKEAAKEAEQQRAGGWEKRERKESEHDQSSLRAPGRQGYKSELTLGDKFSQFPAPRQRHSRLVAIQRPSLPQDADESSDSDYPSRPNRRNYSRKSSLPLQEWPIDDALNMPSTESRPSSERLPSLVLQKPILRKRRPSPEESKSPLTGLMAENNATIRSTGSADHHPTIAECRDSKAAELELHLMYPTPPSSPTQSATHDRLVSRPLWTPNEDREDFSCDFHWMYPTPSSSPTQSATCDHLALRPPSQPRPDTYGQSEPRSNTLKCKQQVESPPKHRPFKSWSNTERDPPLSKHPTDEPYPIKSSPSDLYSRQYKKPFLTSTPRTSDDIEATSRNSWDGGAAATRHLQHDVNQRPEYSYDRDGARRRQEQGRMRDVNRREREDFSQRQGHSREDWSMREAERRHAADKEEKKRIQIEREEGEVEEHRLKTLRPSSTTLISSEILKLIPWLNAILRDGSRKERLLGSHGDDAQRLLDLFQSLLDMPDLKVKFRSRLLLATRELAKSAGILPRCYELHNIKVDFEDDYVDSGGFADIFKCNFQGQAICLKAIRLSRKSEKAKFMRDISKEAVIWAQLDHPNVLMMLGIYRGKSRVCLVSLWMEAGNLVRYLESHPTAPRRHLAMDIAQGLKYLHDNGIIHGDLKGMNVLINKQGVACLADFGLSSLPTVMHTQAMTSSLGTGTVFWTAPELFDYNEDEDAPPPKPTTASDMYSWACVCYEIFIGKYPFWHVKRPPQAIPLHIKAGGRPQRPHESYPSWTTYGLSTAIWSIMEDCWKESPNERPEIEYTIAQLKPMLGDDIRKLGSTYEAVPPSYFRQHLNVNIDIVAVTSILDRI